MMLAEELSSHRTSVLHWVCNTKSAFPRGCHWEQVMKVFWHLSTSGSDESIFFWEFHSFLERALWDGG